MTSIPNQINHKMNRPLTKFELYVTMALNRIPEVVTYEWDLEWSNVLNVKVETWFDPSDPDHPDDLDPRRLDQYLALIEQYPPERKGLFIVLVLLQISFATDDIVLYGPSHVAESIAKKISMYLDSEEFRNYTPRLPLLELDCLMNVHYHHANPIHRYLFDHLMIKDICTYVPPLEKTKTEYTPVHSVRIPCHSSYK